MIILFSKMYWAWFIQGFWMGFEPYKNSGSLAPLLIGFSCATNITKVTPQKKQGLDLKTFWRNYSWETVMESSNQSVFFKVNSYNEYK